MKSDMFIVGERYVLRQKGNEYVITDEAKRTVCRMMCRKSLMNKWGSEKTSRLLFPFRYEITDEQKRLLFMIERKAGIIWDDIFIADHQGHTIGILKQQSLFMQPLFVLKNETGTDIARLQGDWLGGAYTLQAENGTILGWMKRGRANTINRMLGIANNYAFALDQHCPNNLSNLAGICLLFSGMLNRESRIYLSNRS